MSKLVCIHGDNKGDEFPIPEGASTIGRSQDCNFVLFDHSCSRHHCRIHKSGKRYSVEDLDSHNGTYLNGKRIAECVPFKMGAHIRLGNTVLEASTKSIGSALDQAAIDMTAEIIESRQEYGQVLSHVAAAACRGQHAEASHPHLQKYFPTLCRMLRLLIGHHGH